MNVKELIEELKKTLLRAESSYKSRYIDLIFKLNI